MLIATATGILIVPKTKFTYFLSVFSSLKVNNKYINIPNSAEVKMCQFIRDLVDAIKWKLVKEMNKWASRCRPKWKRILLGLCCSHMAYGSQTMVHSAVEIKKKKPINMFTPHISFSGQSTQPAAQCSSSYIYLFDEDLGLKSYLLFSHLFFFFSSIGRRPFADHM